MLEYVILYILKQRGVGQLVDRYIWDVDVASSSLVTPIGRESPSLSTQLGMVEYTTYTKEYPCSAQCRTPWY